MLLQKVIIHLNILSFLIPLAMSAILASGFITKPRVIILPGNGCSPVEECNWYAWLRDRIEEHPAFSECLLRDMPDPDEAYEHTWLPFVIDELKVDENTIVIGHSSGAQAAMRLLENHRLLGCILVSACITDGGLESERIAGYYNRPWQWDRIRSNAKWIIQYHSSDDPFIRRKEPDAVAAAIGSDYTCFDDRSHFFDPSAVRHVLPDILNKLALHAEMTATQTAQAQKKVKKFCILNCENSTAWSPQDFGDMFLHHLSKKGPGPGLVGGVGKDEEAAEEAEEEEWVSINVASGGLVPDAADCHGVVITGSRFNVRDREQLPWFDSVCDLVRQAAATGRPNVYGEGSVNGSSRKL